MKKLFLIAVLLFSCQGVFAQKTDLSKAELEDYSNQIREMVRYLEETFSFIGDPEASAQEKDIIFKESYAKIFKNDQVQIEDDLDDTRSVLINKNVQSYLKDIDFFFQDVKFTFNINDITPQKSDNGDTYFKVTMQRTIAGHNIHGDTVSNVCNRFIEVNIDPFKKDIKIASIYTTKINETEELRTWWNRMTSSWKAYFGKNSFIYDTVEMKNIVHIFNDSIVIVDDNLNENTIACDMSVLYDRLEEYTKITDIDIKGNQYIHTLDPLYELSEIQNLNCSGTEISDISPIRNLNKIYSLDISSTNVTDISDLRYTNEIRVLKADSLNIKNIDIIGYYQKLTNLSLAGSRVTDIKALSTCDALTDLNLSGTSITDLDSVVLPQSIHYLNLSNTEIYDLTPIENLTNLKLLIIDNTLVSNLEPVAKLKKLNELQCRKTGVDDIMPLKDMPNLVRIYCDNTNINSEKADAFQAVNHKAMVIYETKALQEWWDGLQFYWKSAFAKQINCEGVNPTPEQLHAIISMKSLTLDPLFQDAIPVERLTNLERLDMENTKIEDLTPLHGLHNLKYLNIKNTKITDLTPIESLTNLVEINIENTYIANIEALMNMPYLTTVMADNSKVKPEQVFNLKIAQPKVTVIYQTSALRKWWGNIDENWKEVFKSIVGIDSNPTSDQLHAVIYLEEITVDPMMVVTSLETLKSIKFLKKLTIRDNHITDLTPLSTKKLLKELYIDGNAITDLSPLAEVKTLEVLSVGSTNIEDINVVESLVNLRSLDISNTSIKNLKILSKTTSLEELNIANTNIKSLSPIENIRALKYIKAINSKVKVKEIEALRVKRPDINIVYH